ncbi:hypothetical protein HF086_011933 [Spodoptera exigua]|uniref:Pacifastin domain-containing protein n=1 Tax=Spodoptera exigua TaxID=7107 RepID=A0A922M863_SPOEX|nr:hypothetical protein HF086_011933 [Spodoptera exigua]
MDWLTFQCIVVIWVLCTSEMKAQQLNHKKTTPPQLTPLEQCKDGDVIPSSNDCNTCYCIDNRIMCTLIECFDPISDIEGGFNEEDEYSDLQVYQLPVEPSVDVITRNHGKEPARLVYTHTHNDFPVETNVYPGQLSKDTSTLLKALSSRLHDRYYNAPPFDLNTARPNWQTSFHQIQSNPKVNRYLSNVYVSDNVKLDSINNKFKAATASYAHPHYLGQTQTTFTTTQPQIAHLDDKILKIIFPDEFKLKKKSQKRLNFDISKSVKRPYRNQFIQFKNSPLSVPLDHRTYGYYDDWKNKKRIIISSSNDFNEPRDYSNGF